jgi:uncharacterized protein involved in exopolysaccharide biosynthesis
MATSDAPARSVFDWSALVKAVAADRWIIAGVTLVFTTCGVAYALLAPQWYRADVVMVAADQKSMSSALGQLGGLASLAGVSLPSGSNTEPLAVLRSQGFARSFIESRELTRDILEGFGESSSDEDVRDAVKLFETKVRSVIEEKKAGTVTLSIIWRDPVVAADWANSMVRMLNERQRDKALQEAERNVAYLQKEIASSNIISLQQSLGRVLEAEMQKLLLARGNDEFAYKVIDPAAAPKERFSPRRSVIVALSFLAGLIFSSILLISRHFRSLGLAAR